jgi:hypothetical protein
VVQTVGPETSTAFCAMADGDVVDRPGGLLQPAVLVVGVQLTGTAFMQRRMMVFILRTSGLAGGDETTSSLCLSDGPWC